MMEKNSSEGITCTVCGRPALPDTCPPVCSEHLSEVLEKKASEQDSQPETLKALMDA